MSEVIARLSRLAVDDHLGKCDICHSCAVDDDLGRWEIFPTFDVS